MAGGSTRGSSTAGISTAEGRPEEAPTGISLAGRSTREGSFRFGIDMMSTFDMFSDFSGLESGNSVAEIGLSNSSGSCGWHFVAD